MGVTMTREQYKRWQPCFTEFWKIVKGYRNPKEDDDWDKLIEATSELTQKYGSQDYAMIGMIVGFIQGIEKEQKKHGIHK